MSAATRVRAWTIGAASALVARTAAQASLPVLIFHRVLERPDPLLPSEPDAARFDRIVALVSECFNVLPLSEAVRRLKAGTLPPRPLCITFDDGYANNLEIAGPILSRHSAPATVFVAPGFLNGGLMFNDIIVESVRAAPASLDLRGLGFGVLNLHDPRQRIDAIAHLVSKLKYLQPGERLQAALEISRICGARLPTGMMMTDGQVRQLRASGIEVGAHTMTHPILRSVSHEMSVEEILGSKRYLEGLLGHTVECFAYPNGRPDEDYRRDHVDIVRSAGFSVAVTTQWGAAATATDVFQLPRIAPWDADLLKYGLRIARAYRQTSAAGARN